MAIGRERDGEMSAKWIDHIKRRLRVVFLFVFVDKKVSLRYDTINAH